jgi:hypothetical protein
MARRQAAGGGGTWPGGSEERRVPTWFSKYVTRTYGPRAMVPLDDALPMRSAPRPAPPRRPPHQVRPPPCPATSRVRADAAAVCALAVRAETWAPRRARIQAQPEACSSDVQDINKPTVLMKKGASSLLIIL